MNDEVIGLLPQFIQNLNRWQPEYSQGDRIWQLPMRPDVELGNARTAGFIGQVRAYKFREEYNGLRLLGMDNVGIIPEYLVNHRAAQNFDKEDKVFDCAHLYDLPRHNRILPFITWNPMTPLRPFTAPTH